MNWAGFSGSESELNRWLKELKSWSANVARRRRRPDMLEDIEGKALEFLVESQRVGSPLDSQLETAVAKALELNDNYSTARDSDLTAMVNDFSERESVSSYLEEFVDDRTSEDTMLAILDQEEREEGKDQSELVEEIHTELSDLTIEEDQLLSLKHLYGYKQREIAQYIGLSQSWVSTLTKRTRVKLESRRGVKELRKKIEVDPDYTKLEIEWLTI